jgi:hypothetical protein
MRHNALVTPAFVVPGKPVVGNPEFSMTWFKDDDSFNCTTVVDIIAQMSTTLDGISQSNKVRNLKCNANHRHPAFEVLPADDDYLRGKGFFIKSL